MVACPRCAQQVDETTRATCPHCFTPLSGPVPSPPPTQTLPVQSSPGISGQPAAPSTYAPQVSRAVGTRVSLTGEVIDDGAASALAPSYVGGGPAARPPVGAPPRTGGAVASRTAYGATRLEAPAKAGGGNVVAAVLIGLLLLGGLGAGGWWFLTPHSNPKTVVLQYDKALAAQDWKSLYGLVELSAATKSKAPDAASFAAEMTRMTDMFRANPLAAGMVDSFFKAYETAQIGEPTITGDTATVPVTLKLSFSFAGTTKDDSTTVPTSLHMINGLWKVDWPGSAFSGLLPSSGR
jgi:hypothetical protein